MSAKHTNAYSVLIIDDEDALRYSIKRALSQRAFTIYEADSGEAGIEVAKKQKMDIILLANRSIKISDPIAIFLTLKPIISFLAQHL